MEQYYFYGDIPKRKRNCFTDKMYRINLLFAVLVTLYILALMTLSAFVEHIDLSPSAYIIAPIWVEVGAFSLANIRKHEKENRNGYTNGKECVFTADYSAGNRRHEEN